MLVSKSVRIPEELVEFVETRPGETFTEKLVGLLDDLATGKDKRLADLERLDGYIAGRRAALDSYWRLCHSANTLEVRYRSLVTALEKELKDLEPYK